MTELSLHTLKPAPGSKRRYKRLGRGEGSGKGKTAGRGTKGQKARSGGRSGLKLKGMKRVLLRIPKTRGFMSQRPKLATVTLAQLERWFQNGAEVSARILRESHRIPKDAPGAKIVFTGAITKKIIVKGLPMSPKAREAIEQAGGKIEVADTSKKK
jgi:large subunit ribosomal protein L15